VKTDYDAFAVAYARDNESNLINAHYERPAMLALAGDVQGRRVLDVGCGAGPLAAALRENGAIVSGFDSSPVMIELARERLGADTDLRVADLGEPLPYEDGAFDDVVASLVLHYLQDWTESLAELRRVLRPGGRLICSINHPLVYKIIEPEADYFAVAQYAEQFTFAGQDATLTMWHHPLHTIAEAFIRAGFRIHTISEPPYAPNTPAGLLPPNLHGRTAFVCFLFFVLGMP
jgi:ubiquinone/menaquinone biosynthesis C-methylase UbiE